METLITAKQIHDEFYSADEKLLNEAKEIINKPIQDAKKKADRISKLGFGSARPVKSIQEIEAKKTTSADLIKAIEHFRERYPFNKFITEEEVKRICEKYSLVFGDARNYLGDIPDKNLEEIERFELRKDDYTDKSDFVFRGIEARAEMYNQSLIGFEGLVISSRRQGGSWYERQLMQLPQPSLGHYALGYDPYKSEKTSYPKKEKEPLKICAPKEDFHTSGYEIKDGYRLVYDPVVLHPCQHGKQRGYLIVTAWGDEASDEIVVNTINN